MCCDIKKFYLGTPIGQYEYLWLTLNIIPEGKIKQYNLRDMDKNGHVYVEIRKVMYVLP